MMIATGAGPAMPHSATLQRRAVGIAKPLPAGKILAHWAVPPVTNGFAMMRASALKAPKDDLREEVSELRTELERLAGELEEMRSHAATLEGLALEDPLTGLLNRRGFMRDLSRAIAYRLRHPDRAPDVRPRPFQADQRHLRPRGRRPRARASRGPPAQQHPLLGLPRPARRRRVRADPVAGRRGHRPLQGGVAAGDGRRHAAAGRRPDPDALDLDRRRGARGRRHPGAGADAGRPGDVPPEGRAPGEARLTGRLTPPVLR